MPPARLLAVEVESFKSYRDPTRLELKPLTVLVGRNNSGKSTLLQALLLLQQTLRHRRDDVGLAIDGPHVEAPTVKDLVNSDPTCDTMRLAVEWESQVALGADRQPFEEALKVLELDEAFAVDGLLRSRLSVVIAGSNGGEVQRLTLVAWGKEQKSVSLEFEGRRCFLNGSAQSEITARYDRLFPILLPVIPVGAPELHKLSMTASGLLTIFQTRFRPALESLRGLLAGLHYLGGSRTPPSSVIRYGGPGDRVGVSGEFAAQLLEKHRHDMFHCPLPIHRDEPLRLRNAGALELTNDIMRELGVEGPFQIQDIQDLGFRLHFGAAPFEQVGRGVHSLLPLVQAGIFADPTRPGTVCAGADAGLYLEHCDYVAPLVLEEPESNLHPKLQSKLAEWFVALGMAQRQLLIETHSDHLIRRLRRMVAEAPEGSELERWLLDNVCVVEVEPNPVRTPKLHSTGLTRDGAFEERWPRDFMDEATDEESAIYYAGLDKEPAVSSAPRGITHDDGPEPDVPLT